MSLPRMYLMLAGVAALLAPAARAGDCCGSAAPIAAAPAATQKILVTEWVSEPTQVTRTTYKAVTTQQAYTAYRTEIVPETKVVNYTVCKTIPETVMETRTICKKVPVTEQRTEMVSKTRLACVEECRTRTVDRGSWSCVQECYTPRKGFLAHLCDPCSEPCPKVRTKKVWCANPVCETYTVKRLRLVTECVPVTRCVTTYRTEMCTVQVPVTRCRTVSEVCSKTICVNTCRQVPYTAYKCVTTCVPVQETVTVCRMVPRQVEKEVPVCAAATTCCSSGFSCGGKFRGFFHKKACCEVSCDPCATTCGGCH